MRKTPNGFSLAELLIVIAVIGVLAAIAIPALTALRTSSQDGTTQSSLQQVKDDIISTLPVWRGYPPSGTLRICYDSGDFPTDPAAPNTCATDVWTALQTNGTPTSPTLGGTLPAGVTIQGVVAADGTFCINGANSTPGTTTWYVTSSSAQVLEGTCFSAGWTAPTGLIATGAESVAPVGLPSAPTGVTVTAADDSTSVSVNFDSTAGDDFEITVSGQPLRTFAADPQAATGSCVFPASACGGPIAGSLPPGLYSATVRKVQEGNYSPGVVVDFSIPIN